MNYIYIVECCDGSLYTGWTTDIKRRIIEHNSKKGAKYTKTRIPVVLKYFEEFTNRSDAQKRECYIKSLNRNEKLKLIDSSNQKYINT